MLLQPETALRSKNFKNCLKIGFVHYLGELKKEIGGCPKRKKVDKNSDFIENTPPFVKIVDPPLDMTIEVRKFIYFDCFFFQKNDFFWRLIFTKQMPKTVFSTTTKYIYLNQYNRHNPNHIRFFSLFRHIVRR